jgi:hypothetical protein
MIANSVYITAQVMIGPKLSLAHMDVMAQVIANASEVAQTANSIAMATTGINVDYLAMRMV